ncbi:MAG: coproporphyrinogen III oxidase, partial [Pseudomonadota bacterium]
FDLHNIGIKRFSIGIQSLQDNELEFLGRNHQASDALETLRLIGDITDNYSFDLIYALPNQQLKKWQQQLRDALKFASHHLSLYQLTIEKGTEFYKLSQQNKFIMPDNDLAADFYDTTNAIMAESGFNAYEISNYAKRNHECKHNLNYWHYGQYLGIGPGAHSRIKINDKITEIIMLHQPNAWLKSIAANGHAIQKRNILSEQIIKEEFFMMGLRTKSGISEENCQKTLDCNIKTALNPAMLEMLINNDFLQYRNEALSATKQGFPILNAITQKLFA